ncbi:hypothetical protein [Egbenema bharatensis]|uniref:hypothetical protein n=1 Tax=Egbenema bharatensis TaxID=3463334 RepID=UPI003A857917
MNVPNEVIAFASFSVPILLWVWKASNSVSRVQYNLESAINELNHKLDKKDLQLQALQDKAILAINGLSEKNNHLATRYKTDVKDLDSRLDQIENFLAKESGFIRR